MASLFERFSEGGEQVVGKQALGGEREEGGGVGGGRGGVGGGGGEETGAMLCRLCVDYPPWEVGGGRWGVGGGGVIMIHEHSVALLIQQIYKTRRRVVAPLNKTGKSPLAPSRVVDEGAS